MYFDPQFEHSLSIGAWQMAETRVSNVVWFHVPTQPFPTQKCTKGQIRMHLILPEVVILHVHTIVR